VLPEGDRQVRKPAATDVGFSRGELSCRTAFHSRRMYAVPEGDWQVWKPAATGVGYLMGSLVGRLSIAVKVVAGMEA